MHACRVPSAMACLVAASVSVGVYTLLLCGLDLAGLHRLAAGLHAPWGMSCRGGLCRAATAMCVSLRERRCRGCLLWYLEGWRRSRGGEYGLHGEDTTRALYD